VTRDRRAETLERLRDARRLAGMSQEEAARALGVTLRTYARWERGESDGWYRALDRIAEVFHCSPSELVEPARAEQLRNIEDKVDALAADVREVLRRLEAISPGEGAQDG
jgi:transcriptional regulator with XRE-family HTH domain